MIFGVWNSRGGFATIMVLGVIIVAAVVLGMLQTTAFSQAAAGRESLGRVRAYWAARAGVEATIARLEFDTQNPDTSDAFKVIDEMVDVASEELLSASYRIVTTEGKKEVPGPADAHAKLNINRLTRDQLLELEPLMTEDIADSILDWIDPDDEPNAQGAEFPYYMSLPYGYMPRNGPMRSIAELELVAGVDPQDVRGEDWNLNGVLDPNENDGDAAWPSDNADGILDRGWSGVLTAASLDGGLSASGEPRLDLTLSSDTDLMERTKVNRDQAKAILDYVDANQEAQMGDFIRRDLGRLGSGQGSAQPAARVENLTNEQLALLIDECSIGEVDTTSTLPGKLNVNTCDAEILEYLPQLNPEVADAIIAERSGRSDGFTSIIDLVEVPGMTRQQLARIYELLCVRSTVYVVTSRGRDERTGLEVEMMATLDRSTLPVVVTEVVVR
jgi:type II secretory pathway component PulK